MKDAFKPIGAFAIFCTAASLLLAGTNDASKISVDKGEKAELTRGLKKVLPECDNDIVADAKTVEDKGRKWVFYVGRKNGKITGVAFKSSSAKGYGGLIEVFVGVLPDGTVNAVEIGRSKETLGVGSKTGEPSFKNQFKNKKAADTRWAAIRKDNGEIDAVTGATISSRAVTEAVKAGLDVFARYANQVVSEAVP